MNIVQWFCTVRELEEDLSLHGGADERILFSKLKAASVFLSKEIGRFLPVTELLTMRGSGGTLLFTPPFLNATPTITNDGESVSAADLLLRPAGRHWDNGPFSFLELVTAPTSLTSWCADADGVTVQTQWGLYDETLSLGLTLGATMNASVTSMQINDGSKISPGFVGLIGSEMIAVSATGGPTAGVTSLTAELSDNADSGTVASGAALQVGEISRIGIEKMKVLDINGNTVYWSRGWEGTPRSTHANGTAVDVYRTFTILRGLNGTTAASHDSGATVLQQVPPGDVNFLARKVAGRMLLDAQGGFKSRLDDNTGTATHLYILPHELKDIRRAYKIPRVS